MALGGYPKAAQNLKLLAAQQNPQYNYGIQLTGGSDPYNWKGIAAELAQQNNNKKQQNQTKKAAQNRIQAAASSGGGGGGGPVEPVAPNYMVKGELDAYRAANDGALPPGITPEMAAIIDSGVDLAGLSAANPGIVPMLTAIQSQIGLLPSAYDAGRAKVSGDYANLTGDVLTAGQDYMKNLYGNVVDPNDPNAAAFAADPAFAGYANTLGRIEETGDVNEATDLAWFTKNQQAQNQYLQNLLAGVASGAVATGEDIGGGGGGGGGGYGGGRGYGRGGYGGGGYGSGDNEWSDPKTTSTRTDQLRDQAVEKNQFFNPDLWAGIEAAAVDDEQAAAFYDLYTKYGQQPIPIQKGLAEERMITEEKLAELAQQEVSRGAYEENIPLMTEDLINQYRTNMGMVRNTDPEAQGPTWQGGQYMENEKYSIPEEARGRIQDAAMSAQNMAAKKMIQAQAQQEASGLGARLGSRGWGGANNPVQRLKELASNQAKARTRTAQEEYDKEEYLAAKREWDKVNTADNPFPIGDWSGYIPRVNPEDVEEAELYNRNVMDLSAAIYGLDPNISPQRTQLSATTTGTQTDQLQTKQYTYDPNAALGGNLQEIYGQGVGAPMSPFMGGFSSPSYQFDDAPGPQYNDKTGEYEDPVTGEVVDITGGAGYSRMLATPANQRDEKQRIKDRALATLSAKKLSNVRKETGGGWGMSGLTLNKALGKPSTGIALTKEKPKTSVALSGPKTGKKQTVTPPKKAAAAPRSERSIGSASSTAPKKSVIPDFLKPKPPKKAPVKKAATPPKKPKVPKANIIRF